MSQAVKNALLQLDVSNDEHWTKSGLPQVAVVANLSGVLTLTRNELTGIAPGFTRETAAQSAARGPLTSTSQPTPSSDREPEPEAVAMAASGLPSDEEDGEEGVGEGKEGKEAAGDEAESDTPALPPDIREQRLGVIRAEIEALRKEIAVLRAREDQLIRLSDDLVIAGTPDDDALSNQKEIMKWIEAQKREREQRAARHRELIEMGVDPSELAGRKAPIDAAMGRNLGFGQSRPTYPTWRPR